jgi:hypothetical protein
MKTVAEEVVTAAGAPQEGIMQMARSLNPNTNMAQDTGLAQATPVTPTQAPQPQAPQMMSDGGIMRLQTGGGLSGGTISAIASLKVNRPDIYEEYKDDPDMLAMAAEYFSFPATDPKKTGLESLEAPYTDPYGPQGLAQRTAAAEVGNQARMASADAQQTEIDRMLGINAPLGSGRSGAPLDAAARRRIAEEDMAMAVPVPRDDFRTFPVDVPQTRNEKILADARAAIEKYSTNAGRDAAGNLLPVAPEQPFDYGARRDAAGNLLPVAPDYELTEAIEQRKRDEADEFFFNAGMFDRAAPENIAAQPRGSELPTELPTEELRQRLAQEDAAMAMPIPQSDATSATSGRPRAQGIASFGVFDPIVDRFKEIRSEDAARNAAAAEGDLDAFLGVGSENDPTFLGSAMEALSNPVERFKSEMAARQAAGERNYANAVQGVEALNQRIADAKAAGDEILAQQLTTARDQLGGTLRNQERADDVVEGILAIPQSINKAFQQSSLGVGLRGPDATARTLTALEAEQEAAKKAEATRERRLAELLGGATPTVMDAAEVAQEEFDQRPDTQDVKPAAESQRIAEAIEDTTTTPAATKDTTRDTTTDTSTSVGSSGRIAQMLEDRQKSAESDKWMALAQTGLALMASNQPTLGGAIGEAGLAGIGALQQSRQGMQDFEMDMLKLQTQIDAANRKSSSKGGLTAGNIISYVDDLARQQSDVQDKLDELDTGVFMGTEEQKEAIRKRLQTNLFQVNLELSTYRNALRGGQPSSGSSFDVTGGSQSTGN